MKWGGHGVGRGSPDTTCPLSLGTVQDGANSVKGKSSVQHSPSMADGTQQVLRECRYLSADARQHVSLVLNASEYLWLVCFGLMPLVMPMMRRLGEYSYGRVITRGWRLSGLLAHMDSQCQCHGRLIH